MTCALRLIRSEYGQYRLRDLGVRGHSEDYLIENTAYDHSTVAARERTPLQKLPGHSNQCSLLKLLNSLRSACNIAD